MQNNKFYKEGFNDADSTIQDPYTSQLFTQGPVSFDFTPPMTNKQERQLYIKGYENHILQSYPSNGNPIYFFPF